MANKPESLLVPQEIIERKIYLLRDKKVMLDSDLADLYKVETKVLNQAVKRNIQRFPDDFMFQLTIQEVKNLRSQFVTSSQNWGGRRLPPYAFTELGVAMLSSVLNSDQAIEINIQIMRTFTKLRLLLSNEDLRDKIKAMQNDYDKKFLVVFESISELFDDIEDIKKMLAPLPQTREKAGFIKENEKKTI